MELRDWLCSALSEDFNIPGQKVYDTDKRFQKWVNGMNHEAWLKARKKSEEKKFKYTTCMDFLMGVHNRIKTDLKLHGKAAFRPYQLDKMYPLAYHTFDAESGDIPQSGDFYLCSIPGGRHAGVFLEVSENALRTVCGGADDSNGGAIVMNYAWPSNLLGWLNIDEFYY